MENAINLIIYNSPQSVTKPILQLKERKHVYWYLVMSLIDSGDDLEFESTLYMIVEVKYYQRVGCVDYISFNILLKQALLPLTGQL